MARIEEYLHFIQVQGVECNCTFGGKSKSGVVNLLLLIFLPSSEPCNVERTY